MNILTQIGILAAAFVAVISLVLWGARRAEALLSIQRRMAGERRTVTAGGPLIRRQGPSHPLLAWVQRSTSLSDEDDRRKLTRLLRQAGFEHPSAPALFVVVRLALAMGLPILFLLSQTLRSEPITGAPLILAAVFACGVGFIAPSGVVERMARGKRERLEHEFPDALDLMVVCVEAGLGMEAAFVRVGEEVRRSHPLISHQFELVSQELRAGRSRAEALRSLADRTDIPAIRSFTALLIQTDTLGGSIAQTLRTYSQEMRERRFLNAEEKALRVPVLLTIPLVVCMLPVIVAALMLPAGIEVAQTLLPALQGTAP